MLLERFRRPRWRHPDPEVRRQAVLRLSWENGDERDILEGLVREDASAAVRAAAVKRVDDLVLLRGVLEDDADANVRESARARYRQRLASGSGGIDLEARHHELACCADAQVLAHVARSGREESLRAAALDQIGDPAVLAESALNDPVARLRQRAVERLQDVALLAQVAERARGQDSRVARLARDRHARISRHRREQAQASDEARRILASLDELMAAGAGHANARAQWQRLEARRRSLPDMPEELAAALDERLAAVAGTLSADPGDTVTTADRDVAGELAAAMAGLEAGDLPLEQGLEALEGVLARAPASADQRFARAALWCEAGRRLLGAETALRGAAADGDSERLRDAINAVAWPQRLPSPRVLLEADRALAALERGEAPPTSPGADEPAANSPPNGGDATVTERGDAPTRVPTDGHRRLLAELEQVEQDLAEGRFRPARRVVARLRRQARQQSRGLPSAVERRLSRAAARIAEWRDWRRFAVEPKQAELCEMMEALAAEVPDSPQDRLARVRALRAEWKATGGSDSPASRALWGRFREAADEAAAPCREWLRRTAEQRRANTALRRQVNEELNGFLARMAPEGLATEELARIRSTARAEWQAAQPADDRALKQVERQFEAAMDRISRLIQQRRKAAGADREALVTALEALAEESDIERAVVETKRLQALWKTGERAHPRVERALWKRLRAASDAVFERRDRQRQASKGRQKQDLDALESLCAALEAVAAETSGDPDALRGRLNDARGRFGALSGGSSPRARALHHRFERAAQAVNRRIEVAERQGWDDFLVTLEAQVHRAFLAPERQTGPPEWPRGLPDEVRVALQERWSAAQQSRAPTPLAPERAREIVVRLEILAGRASPSEDQPLRLAQQVDRLSSGIGAGQREAPVAEAWRLATEWLASGSADSALEVRFWDALRGVMAG